jgi:hypothetical protein
MKRRTPLRKRNPRTKGQRFPHRRDAEYREWIRGLPCTVLDGCSGEIQCAHVKSRGAGGDDLGNAVPLWARHHGQQHSWGIRTFEGHYRVDLGAMAQSLAEQYRPPDLAF